MSEFMRAIGMITKYLRLFVFYHKTPIANFYQTFMLLEVTSLQLLYTSMKKHPSHMLQARTLLLELMRLD